MGAMFRKLTKERRRAKVSACSVPHARACMSVCVDHRKDESAKQDLIASIYRSLRTNKEASRCAENGAACGAEERSVRRRYIKRRHTCVSIAPRSEDAAANISPTTRTTNRWCFKPRQQLAKSRLREQLFGELRKAIVEDPELTFASRTKPP